MRKKALTSVLDELTKVADKTKPKLSGASSGAGKSKGKQLEFDYKEEEKILLGSQGKKASNKDTDQLLKEILDFARGKKLGGKTVSPETERAYRSFFNRTMREP
jgi:hypothetical protein|tara:strand:+ start:1620 stop:1931 length:312 start_codon:yes stop_codon:yes gene_type:complete